MGLISYERTLIDTRLWLSEIKRLWRGGTKEKNYKQINFTTPTDLHRAQAWISR